MQATVLRGLPRSRMAGPGTTQPSSTDAGVPAALLDDDDPALFPKLSDSQLDLLAKHGHVRAITAGGGDVRGL